MKTTKLIDLILLISATLTIIFVIFLFYKRVTYAPEKIIKNELQSLSKSIDYSNIDLTKLNYKKLIQNEVFHISLSLAYGEANLLEQAIFESKEAIRVNPKSYWGYNNLGYFLMLKGKYKEAEENLKKAIKLKPDFEYAKNNLKLLYEKLKGMSKQNSIEK